jgi:hypothetical protein
MRGRDGIWGEGLDRGEDFEPRACLRCSALNFLLLPHGPPGLIEMGKAAYASVSNPIMHWIGKNYIISNYYK